MIQISYYFLVHLYKGAGLMSLAEHSNTSIQPSFIGGGIQAEIDRILERVGALVCEDEDDEYVTLTKEIEKIEVEEVHTQKMEFNAYTYTKHPAIIHGKYSIPKTWVKDEDVAKAVIREDTEQQHFFKTVRNVAYYLYKELAI